MARYGLPGRSPYGERGLKFRETYCETCPSGRSPYGERGLKSLMRQLPARRLWSLSLRRAWIEIKSVRY